MPSADIIELLTKGGAFGIMALMWWRAEARADRERSLNETLTRESIASSVKTEATLSSLAMILTGRKADA